MQFFVADLTMMKYVLKTVKLWISSVSFAEKTLCSSTVQKSIFLRFGLWRFTRTFWRPTSDNEVRSYSQGNRANRPHTRDPSKSTSYKGPEQIDLIQGTRANRPHTRDQSKSSSYKGPEQIVLIQGRDPSKSSSF